MAGNDTALPVCRGNVWNSLGNDPPKDQEIHVFKMLTIMSEVL